MLPDERIALEMWELLKRLQTESLRADSDEMRLSNFYAPPSYLRKLTARGAIAVETKNIYNEVLSGRMGWYNPQDSMPGRFDTQTDVKIIRNKFDKVYSEFEKKIAPLTKGAGDGLLVFTFTQDGVLCRKDPLPKDKHYSMEEGSGRRRVMRALVDHSHTGRYIATKNLHEELDLSESRIRRVVSELRAKFNRCFLCIRNTDIIESKARSGYRINPKIRIVEM